MSGTFIATVEGHERIVKKSYASVNASTKIMWRSYALTQLLFNLFLEIYLKQEFK